MYSGPIRKICCRTVCRYREGKRSKLMIRIGVVPSNFDHRNMIINQDYLDAILRAGGLPVLFPLTSDEMVLRTLLEQVDGLLLTGGVDIEPARYGEEKSPSCGPCSPERDAMEYPLCRTALEISMPILAICRGMQLLSCVLGSTLYQDLGTQFSSDIIHAQPQPPADLVHDVAICPDSLLASIIRKESLGVNSRHHQGVKVPGKDLTVCATATDGLIEGVELPGAPFVLGVQWHPETLSSRYPAHQQIFDAFVRACATHHS